MLHTRSGPGLFKYIRSTAKLYSTKNSSSRSPVLKYGTPAAAAIAAGASALWWLAASRDDVPSLDHKLTMMIKSGMSEKEVTQVLCKEAYSFSPRRKSGVERYDGTRVAANSPCEDMFVHGQLPSPYQEGKDWFAWGIFDGHSGWQTAELLSKQLVPFVRTGLEQAKTPGNEKQGIMEGFVQFDDAILKTAFDTAYSKVPLHEKIKTLAPAFAGSCALLSLYNPSQRTLYVACTGDARAVLGRKSADGKWEAIALSTDHDGSNEDEISRISREHPGEADIAQDGRIFGLMPSRAFGDAQWKLPPANLSEFNRRFKTPAPLTPRYPVLTPPYLTAEPVVTTTQIDPSTRSFLIMASDGLWFSMSNQDAVDAIGNWLDGGMANHKQTSKYHGFDFSARHVPWRYTEECSTVEDDNAAVHLVRNTLGGNNRELVAARLAFWPARRVIDDITVQVVFFDQS